MVEKYIPPMLQIKPLIMLTLPQMVEVRLRLVRYLDMIPRYIKSTKTAHHQVIKKYLFLLHDCVMVMALTRRIHSKEHTPM